MGDDDKPRILIVDDDPTIREMLSIFFEQEYGARGYVIETHGGGTPALESAARRRPALVLLDIDMPDLGGVETLRCLRTLHETVPVIMITGNASTKVAGEVIGLGAFSYLPKPVKLNYLAHLVSAVMGGLEGPPKPPTRSAAPRQSRGAPR
jgi:DNA-binding response OmpR family regulator